MSAGGGQGGGGGSAASRLPRGRRRSAAGQRGGLARQAAGAPRRHAATLRKLRGRQHRLISGVVVVRDGAVLCRHVEVAELAMRDYSDRFIDWYLDVAADADLQVVGACRLEGLGAQAFARIDGDYFTILGLPLLPLLGCPARGRRAADWLSESSVADGLTAMRRRSEPHCAVAGAALAGVIGWPVAPLAVAAAARLLAAALRHRRRLRAAGGAPGAISPTRWRRCRARLPRRQRDRAAQGGGARRWSHEATPAARRIGAVNTIVVGADGRLIGQQHRRLRLP